MSPRQDPPPLPKEVDVVVLGSGGAGLMAATVAAHHGLQVLLAEKTDYFGGTTAWSGGGLWVPANALAAAAGLSDSPQAALDYVQAVVGPTLRRDLAAAFVDAAPRMVDFLHNQTAVRLKLQRGFADWHPDAPGFCPDGRLLSPLPFDGRSLGPLFDRLRPPLREFNAPGGLMLGLDDLPHLAQMRRSWHSLRHMAGLLLRFGWDSLRHSRGTRLVMGNALAAHLLQAASQAGVQLRSQTALHRLIWQDGAVRGVLLARGGRFHPVHTRRGVVLATGGFSANPEWRRQYIPFPDQHVSLTAEGNTGDGLAQALAAGARWDGDNHSNAGWVVVSVLRLPDGRLSKFPHLFLDRGKPGCIAVNRAGQRFGNESAANLVEPMHRSGSVPAWLVCDDRFIHRYGLGLVRPGGFGLRRLQALGYIQSAPSLAALADRLGVDAAGLQATVARFNRHAALGQDPDFGRGSQPSDAALGDRQHQPNPCLGPLLQPPFHAVQVFPGDSTTTLGLRIDAQARVLDPDDQPLLGLHAVGLDMNSLWRGRAPGNGANNGLGLTFGYLAGLALTKG